MKNKVKEKIQRGEQVIGTFVTMGGERTLRALGYAGLDYVILDMEHGPYDVEQMVRMIITAEAADLTPMVRIADVTHGAIQRMVDIGARALIVPCLRDIDEFRKTVHYAKFAPIGNRGFAMGIGSGYGYEDWADGIDQYMKVSNEQLLVLPQCETAESLENIEEIVKIEGVDGIFVGPFDLSIALGIPAQFDDERFITSLARIKKACDDVNKPVFMYTGTIERAHQYLDEGFAGIAHSGDANVLVDAYRAVLDQIKNR